MNDAVEQVIENLIRAADNIHNAAAPLGDDDAAIVRKRDLEVFADFLEEQSRELEGALKEGYGARALNFTELLRK